MSIYSNHSYHSTRPLTASIEAATIASVLLKLFHQYMFILENLIIILYVYQWWHDVYKYIWLPVIRSFNWYNKVLLYF